MSDTPISDEADAMMGNRGIVAFERMEALERKYNDAMRRADILEAAARQTLDECGHLADGENCTLIVLKRAVREIDSLHAQDAVDISEREVEVKK